MDITKCSVALIDDDPIHLEIIGAKLRNVGVTNLQTFSEPKDVLTAFEESHFDLLFSDFYLGGNFTFADLFNNSLFISNTPTIIISSFYDQSVLDQILQIKPLQFLSKTCSEFEMTKAIAMAMQQQSHNIIRQSKEKHSAIFVRSGSKLKRVIISEIWHIKVSNNYLEIIYSNRSKVAIRSTLNDFLKKLPDNFIKANQSEAVNMYQIKEIDIKNSLVVLLNDTEIALSRNFRRLFIDKFQFK